MVAIFPPMDKSTAVQRCTTFCILQWNLILVKFGEAKLLGRMGEASTEQRTRKGLLRFHGSCLLYTSSEERFLSREYGIVVVPIKLTYSESQLLIEELGTDGLERF